MSEMTRHDGIFGDDDIVDLARSVEAHDFERIAPPPLVWENIVADVEVDRAEAEANARRRSSRWWTGPPRLLAIAAATLLMVGVVAAVVSSRPDEQPLDEIATAFMTDDDLPVATDETALATVVCDDKGCGVDIDLTALPDPGNADLELWVINGDVTDMHSLGVVTESGRYALPDGVGPDDFPIVDISVEPRDGVAAHSGQSVLRGVFSAV